MERVPDFESGPVQVWKDDTPRPRDQQMTDDRDEEPNQNRNDPA